MYVPVIDPFLSLSKLLGENEMNSEISTGKKKL